MCNKNRQVFNIAGQYCLRAEQWTNWIPHLTTLNFCVFWNCKWNSIQFLLLSGGKHYLHIKNIILPHAILLQRPQSVHQYSLGSCNDFCFIKGWDLCFSTSHPTCWQYLVYFFLESGSFRGSKLPPPDLTGRKWLILLNGQLTAGCAASNRQHPISFGCSTHIIDNKQRQWKNPPLQIAEMMFWQLSFSVCHYFLQTMKLLPALAVIHSLSTTERGENFGGGLISPFWIRHEFKNPVPL